MIRSDIAKSDKPGTYLTLGSSPAAGSYLEWASNGSGRLNAVLSGDNTLYITMINKEHGHEAHDAVVTLGLPANYRCAELVRLEDSSGGVQEKTGLRLGGVELQPNAVWNGAWKPLVGESEGGRLRVTVSAASATILKISLKARSN